jgi:hypothetical protein
MHNAPYHQITEYLYLGNIKSVQLQNNPFTLIVNCTHDIPFPKNCKNGIRIPINDNPKECDKLLMLMNNTNVLDIIHYHIQQKQPVLVHCFAGMQRSCALTACYLMKYYQLNPIKAVEYIRSRRPVAFFDGANFWNAIQIFYVKLHSSLYITS